MEAIKHKVFGIYTLHQHQVAAIQWMIQREQDEEMRGGFLCDEMGLGKTVTSIGLIINSPKTTTLVLAPIAVLKQWTRTFVSANGPAVFERKNKKWSLCGGNLLKGRVFVTNYDKLVHEREAFNMEFGRIICDEAHTVRNYHSKKYKALKTIKSNSYWFLTGTPIVNTKRDVMALLALNHTKLSIYSHATDERITELMGKYAMARRASEVREVIRDIFPKDPQVVNHRLDFTTEDEQIFYRGIQGRIAQQLQHLMEEDNPNMLAMLTLLLRLRQISVHPQIYISSKKKKGGYTRADWTTDSTKTEKIVDILRSDKGNHGYVIFCNFKEEIELLTQRLSQEECVSSIVCYNGELSEEQRANVIDQSIEDMSNLRNKNTTNLDKLLKSVAPKAKELPEECLNNINEFVGPKHVVFLAQIHCAGTGLNLQHMDRVIFTTPWWTAALMDQAVGRVLRLGQQNQVVIHYITLAEEDLVSLNIDDFIYERVEAKREMCQLVLNAANHNIFPLNN
jgi:SNF2 family DNA or RNA helicase